MNKYLDTLNRIIKDYDVEIDQDVQELIDFLSAQDAASKPVLTESGLAILEYLQGCNSASQKAKDIAEGMGIASRKVSGSIRKLVSDSFVNKFGSNPVIYSLTEKGKTFDIKSYKERLNDEKGHE